MSKFFNSDMADLAHQLTLSPRRLRIEQVARVEKLLAAIAPDRVYPFEFVCFGITGYRKRGACAASASIPGRVLLADLVTLTEVISRKANLKTAELRHPYKTNLELAEYLNVSTKTVRRWRSRGLMGLRVVFDDGVNRLVFCQETIDRFVRQHKALVEKGASFRQLTVAERQGIVDRAQAILAKRPMKLHAAARIIAEDTGRAVETIRYTLRRYDDANRDKALFSKGAAGVHCERHGAIWRCFEAGEPLSSIARAFECSTDDVERVLREIELSRLKEHPPGYVYNELFDAPGADALILEVPEPVVDEPVLTPAPAGLPSYLRSLYATPLLSRQQEADLFRRYNYLKFKVARLLERIDPARAGREELEAVRSLMTRTDELRQRIIRANLRLVVSIAKKHVGWSTGFFEVISDGNVSLMRAVERFDYSRGNKFSTYATWAIMKNYARSIPVELYHTSRYLTGQETVLEAAADNATLAVPESDRRRVKAVIADGLEELDDREREIVTRHYGLGGSGDPLTLEQLGRRYGVTKERIRQIERRALARLRELLAPSIMDAVAD